VGVIASLRPGIYGASPVPVAPAEVTSAIVSPWAPSGQLAAVVWNDIFDGAVAPLSRAEAMRVPAVRRARNIACQTIARVPLRDYRRGEDAPLAEGEQAPWIAATDDATPAYQRMVWTVDDLFFYGVSCWARTANAAPTAAGRILPLRMGRLPMGAWRIEEGTGRVLLPTVTGAWRPATGIEVVLFFGPDEGLLIHGADAIRHAADLQRAAGKAAKHPAPYLDLHQIAGDPFTDPEIDALKAQWLRAREADGGGIGYTNQSIELRAVGTFSEHLVLEGRNVAAVDIARHANLPAELLDATGTGGTLTYQTSRDNDRRTIDYGLGGLMSAISSRLSQNDVHPNTRRVAFDLEEWLRGTVPGQPAPQTPAPAPAQGLATPTPSPAAGPVPASTTTDPGETPQ
jgi:hypothetical protein